LPEPLVGLINTIKSILAFDGICQRAIWVEALDAGTVYLLLN